MVFCDPVENEKYVISKNDTKMRKIKDVTQSLFLFLTIPTNNVTRKRMGKQSRMVANRFIMYLILVCL